MARMYSRKHGKHGSTKPPRRRHQWMVYEREEVEEIIKKLTKDGKSDAAIGLILRDQYGVPDVRVFGLRVSKVVKTTTKKEVPDDMYNLIERAVNLHGHLSQHHGDAKAIHGLELLESKIRRLGKYYARKGELPKKWKYSIEQAKLLVK